VVQIFRGENVIVARQYQDPGGLASFYLLRDGSRVTVVDGLVRGFVLDTSTGGVAEVNSGTVPRDFPEQSFGRFTFVAKPDHKYRWVLREGSP
jgi:hypothetical protein